MTETANPQLQALINLLDTNHEQGDFGYIPNTLERRSMKLGIPHFGDKKRLKRLVVGFEQMLRAGNGKATDNTTDSGAQNKYITQGEVKGQAAGLLVQRRILPADPKDWQDSNEYTHVVQEGSGSMNRKTHVEITRRGRVSTYIIPSHVSGVGEVTIGKVIRVRTS